MWGFATLAVALLFAANIGASGTAASISETYGSGALRTNRMARMVVAFCALAGALLAGAKVTETIGGGIVPAGSWTAGGALVVLAASCATLMFANFVGIPLSTSEVTVGALVGLGLAAGALQTARLPVILSSWVVLPLLAFLLSWIAGRAGIGPFERWLERRASAGWTHFLRVTLLITGGYQAFSAGTNNVGNAVGPLLGGGIVDVQGGIAFGGAAMAAGAFLLGGRVLETNAKRITPLSLPAGILITAVGGTLVLTASLLGLPVPLTQVTTGAILGLGIAARGRRVLAQGLVRRIVCTWFASPLISMVLAYTAALAVLHDRGSLAPLGVVIVAAGTLASAWIIWLARGTPGASLEPATASPRAGET